jgi:hypothetical protein
MPLVVTSCACALLSLIAPARYVLRMRVTFRACAFLHFLRMRVTFRACNLLLLLSHARYFQSVGLVVTYCAMRMRVNFSVCLVFTLCAFTLLSLNDCPVHASCCPFLRTRCVVTYCMHVLFLVTCCTCALSSLIAHARRSHLWRITWFVTCCAVSESANEQNPHFTKMFKNVDIYPIAP